MAAESLIAQSSLRFGTVDRLALFGGSWIVAALLPELRRRGVEYKLFTSPRHLTDVVTVTGDTLEQVIQRETADYHVSDAINEDPEALTWAGERTLGIAFGAAWTFAPDFADRFAGRMLDFMGIRLPEYRGGAHYTWQILNADRRGACNLQVILGGEESFHRGPIIKSSTYALRAETRTPQGYFAEALVQESRFILEFLEEVAAGREFELRSLDERQASYFPFLGTRVHGWIDWSWTAEEIARFINAFGDPYAGASTYWRAQPVLLKEAEVQQVAGIHPFAAGLVYRKDERGIGICARGGTLLIRRATDGEGEDVVDRVAVGSRFFTPTPRLEEALTSEISYGSSGPTVESFLP